MSEVKTLDNVSSVKNTDNNIDIRDENSEYFVDEMTSTNKDYPLIKKCFEGTMLKAGRCPDVYVVTNVETVKIYEVKRRKDGKNTKLKCVETAEEKCEITSEWKTVEKKCCKKIKQKDVKTSEKKNVETTEQKDLNTAEKTSRNLLLFHGTSHDNAIGILQEGFRSSLMGMHGPGVYLSEGAFSAVMFSRKKVAQELEKAGKTLPKKQSYFIFVNEILESENLKQLPCMKTFTGSSTAYPGKHKFSKYVKKGTPVIFNKYEKDSKGRKIKCSEANVEDEFNYYVCDQSLVVPRYLIQCYSDCN